MTPSTRFIVLVHLAAMLLSQGCVNSLLLHPSTRREPAGTATQRLISLDGRTIEVWIARSPGAARDGPRAGVLDFTGNATRAEWVVEALAEQWGERPVEVWVMNYPGYGASTGPASLQAIPPAALAVYDALASEHPGRPIIVTGSSLGCATALCVASSRPAAGMVLQNPPPIQRMILQEEGWWNLWLGAAVAAAQVPAELDALSTSRRVRSPAIFILSRLDRTVPFRYQQLVADAYAGEKRVIIRPDADHNTPLSADDAQSLQQALDWLWLILANHRPA